MIVAPSYAEPCTKFVRSVDQRKLGSSWKPTHMRSAASAGRGGERSERAQDEDEADGASHRITPPAGRVRERRQERFRHPSGSSMRCV